MQRDGLPSSEIENKPIDLPASESGWSEPSCSGFNEIADLIAKMFLCGLIAITLGIIGVWIIGGGQ